MRRRLMLVAAIAVATVSVAVAQGLPKLPPDAAIPQGKDSPGKVVFSHATHVDQAKPECTACHPKPFRILDPAVTTGTERLLHSQMEKGAQCGKCHNGKDARGFDDCTMCHRSQ